MKKGGSTMMLANYTPFDVDKFLSDALGTVGAETVWAPACNAYEVEQGFWIQAALPGMERKDINISLEDGLLTLKGERKEETAESQRTYFLREIGSGPFSRSFRLPTNVDASKASATYKDGVLTVGLPKREEAKPSRITIETA
ncbi:MAG: Hsp20/alpha crystallin family protein [Nitrospirae bacterium]|nr:MAG: Hsp20/alpha crystallin family protein [Nitrospirota bacterium]